MKTTIGNLTVFLAALCLVAGVAAVVPQPSTAWAQSAVAPRLGSANAVTTCQYTPAYSPLGGGNAGQTLFLKCDPNGNLLANPAVVGSLTAWANFTASGSGATQLVSAVAGKAVYVTSIEVAMAAAGAVKLVSGTGSNCAAGTADLTGTYQGASALMLGSPNSYWQAPAAAAVCVNLGANATGTVEIHYVQQ